MKVLVINQCSHNKGDRALLYFVLRELDRNNIKDITVSASHPAYWRKYPDFPEGVNPEIIPYGWNVARSTTPGFFEKAITRIKRDCHRKLFFPLMREAFLKGVKPWYVDFLCNRSFVRALKNADLVLSTGGHHVTTMFAKDGHSPQMFDMAASLVYGKPLILWSQTIGTFEFSEQRSKEMIRKILRDVQQLIVRDKNSLQELKDMDVSREHVYETSESVFGLCDLVSKRIAPSEREKIMGLSVYTANKGGDYIDYAKCLSKLVNHAINSGYRIKIFPMQLDGADMGCIQAIVNMASNKDKCEVMGFPPISEHLDIISRCRLFVGHKTHSIVFSLTVGTPLIAIAYHKKTSDFMEQFGIGEYALPDEYLTSDKLKELFSKIEQNLDEISHKQQIGFQIGEQARQDFAAMIERFKKSR